MTLPFTKIPVTVIEHIMLKNMWEYYVIKPKKGDSCTTDMIFAYVIGFENELGYVSLAEIAPYIITRTKDLSEIMPAPNCSWIEAIP
jgi:hypothetical protein